MTVCIFYIQREGESMKKILLACASGIATSTAVNHKLSTILDERGYKGKYRVAQCKVQEVFGMSEDYDFCVATTNIEGEVKCPVILGVAFLTGRGLDGVLDQVMQLMEQ